MITPLFLTSELKNRKAWLDRLNKELITQDCYVFIKDAQLVSPTKISSSQLYQKLSNSSKTVLFWSSKTPLFSFYLIYSVENERVFFEYVASSSPIDVELVQRCMELSAYGIKLFFFNSVQTVRIPMYFFEDTKSKKSANCFIELAIQ